MTSPRDHSAPRSSIVRCMAVAVAVVTAVGLAFYYRDAITVDRLADHELSLRTQLHQRPLIVYGVSFFIYVAATGFSLPGATALSLFCGWYFGFIRGLVFVSFASTAGATAAFLLSRYLFREPLRRRFAARLDRFNEALHRDGAYYLLTLRLIPAVPFFVINLVAGLTPLRVTTFWWVSQLGMLPGTAVIVYAGSQMPHVRTIAKQGASGIFTPQLLLALTLLGLLPVVLRWLLPGKLTTTSESASESA